ncbi:MAG: hypothetical protein ACTSRA_13060 [Promethearchaeota archaeon]
MKKEKYSHGSFLIPPRSWDQILEIYRKGEVKKKFKKSTEFFLFLEAINILQEEYGTIIIILLGMAFKDFSSLLKQFVNNRQDQMLKRLKKTTRKRISRLIKRGIVAGKFTGKLGQEENFFILNEIKIPLSFRNKDVPEEIRNEVLKRLNRILASRELKNSLEPLLGVKKVSKSDEIPEDSFISSFYETRVIKIDSAMVYFNCDECTLRMAIENIFNLEFAKGAFLNLNSFRIDSDLKEFLEILQKEIGKSDVRHGGLPDMKLASIEQVRVSSGEALALQKPVSDVQRDKDIDIESKSIVPPGNTFRMLEKMFRVSRSLKIDDAVGILKIDRLELLSMLINWASELGIVIDGEYIILQEDVDFSSRLDEQFKKWNEKERKKEGKLANTNG